MKKSYLICRTILLSWILVLGTNVVNAAVVKLDFTTYTQYRSVCTASTCTSYDFWSNPIVSQYQITLDTSELFNSAYSDAYNNATNFTESVTTSVSNSSGTYPDYSSKSSTVSQTYTQYESNGAIIGDMSNSASFNEYYGSTATEEREYTGNLPPELAPDNTTAAIKESGGTSLNWSTSIGSVPIFAVFDEAELISFYDSLIGEQFDYYKDQYNESCSELDMYGYCIDYWTTYLSINDGGYALLSATTVVPVPATVWLFGSGLIGLIGLARRKKA